MAAKISTDIYTNSRGAKRQRKARKGEAGLDSRRKYNV